MTVAAVQCVLTPKTGVRVAIHGRGVIGRQRAASLPPGSVTVCCDLAAPRAVQLAAATRGAAPSTDWQATVRRADVDAGFIATTHDQLAPIAAEAAAAGKHVLIEKPGARRASELDAVADAARRCGGPARSRGRPPRETACSPKRGDPPGPETSPRWPTPPAAPARSSASASTTAI